MELDPRLEHAVGQVLLHLGEQLADLPGVIQEGPKAQLVKMIDAVGRIRFDDVEGERRALNPTSPTLVGGN